MKIKSNTNLNTAKRAKCDEFYTQYCDIEKELIHYKDKFVGKVVYCNCDDYTKSNFTKYFKDNFSELKLKKLISTGLNAKYYEYDGEVEIVKDLTSNGDFCSEECTSILKQSDIVVTNPPFSLFRKYISHLLEHSKKFLIVGNMNGINYQEVFPYVKNNELWLVYRNLGSDFFFHVPEYYKEELMTTKTQGGGWRIINGVVMARVANACWYTNLDNKNHNKFLELTQTYQECKYPKYDNHDAIEIPKISEIPMDYDGVMGVPITFLGKYCPEQFEIVGDAKTPIIGGKKIYKRLLVRKKQ